MQKTVSVVGGDPELNKRLTADPSDFQQYVEWAGSVADESSLASMKVVELWILMKDGAKKEIREYAKTVRQAYEYIVNHPQAYSTHVTLDIQSDCKAYVLSKLTFLICDSQGPNLIC